MRKLAETLRAAGHKVMETREPGGTATGRKSGEVLLDSKTEGLSPLAEMALMFASRAQHIAEVIQPALDRRTDCALRPLHRFTEAYQGGGRKLGMRGGARVASRSVRRFAAGPDHPAGFRSGEERGARAAAEPDCRRPHAQKIRQTRRREPLRTGESGIFARVRKGYLAIAAREPQRVVVVDASGTPDGNAYENHGHCDEETEDSTAVRATA